MSLHAHSRLRAAVRFGFMLLIAASIPACGGNADLPKLGKVRGKVTYKGKPVESGHIVFTPAEGKGGETGQSATGEIGSDGSYEMTTFNTGDGAILGQHIVTVELREKADPNLGKPKADGTIDYKLPKSQGPKQYAKVDTSPLRITVKEGSQDFPIELKD